MPRGWEGNCRSGVALAMRHRLVVYPLTGSTITNREISTPPMPWRSTAHFTFLFENLMPIYETALIS